MPLIEMPDVPSVNDEIENLSEIDLLLLYAEQARPRENDSYRGFYLEELPARFPQTRLFRLPYKWAYEFILRKDNREKWSSELHKEYSFFSRQDFSRVIKNFGARLLYSAPHWDEEILKNHYNNKLRLFSENGDLLGTPETSFVLVAQKSQERESLTLQERRPSTQFNPHMNIIAMRDSIEGESMDIVTRDLHLCEIMPYRVTEENKLHVYLHQGIPRCLANTIPRKGANIDGKQWSGHMIETFALPRPTFENLDFDHVRSTLKFSKDNLGLTPQVGALFENGPGFYPAPDFIDEHVTTLYLNVRAPDGDIKPQSIMDDASGFSTSGVIREIDAQQILNAISVGLIPFSRLEIQILGLYEKLGLSYQSWAQCPLSLQTEEPSGDIKTMQSIFVDEGQDHGGIAGLASREKDFVINEEGSMNVAVVLPLTKSINGEVMAGFIEQYLPVPQRYKGNGFALSCPSLTLPLEIENLDQAKKFIADKFEVPLENVARMGES